MEYTTKDYIPPTTTIKTLKPGSLFRVRNEKGVLGEVNIRGAAIDLGVNFQCTAIIDGITVKFSGDFEVVEVVPETPIVFVIKPK